MRNTKLRIDHSADSSLSRLFDSMSYMMSSKINRKLAAGREYEYTQTSINRVQFSDEGQKEEFSEGGVHTFYKV